MRTFCEYFKRRQFLEGYKRLMDDPAYCAYRWSDYDPEHVFFGDPDFLSLRDKIRELASGSGLKNWQVRHMLWLLKKNPDMSPDDAFDVAISSPKPKG